MGRRQHGTPHPPGDQEVFPRIGPLVQRHGAKRNRGAQEGQATNTALNQARLGDVAGCNLTDRGQPGTQHGLRGEVGGAVEPRRGQPDTSLWEATRTSVGEQGNRKSRKVSRSRVHFPALSSDFRPLYLCPALPEASSISINEPVAPMIHPEWEAGLYDCPGQFRPACYSGSPNWDFGYCVPPEFEGIPKQPDPLATGLPTERAP